MNAPAILRVRQMLKGKQRRFLRAMGTGLDPILLVGKDGISQNVVQQLDEALEARELVKVRFLSNFGTEIKEAAQQLAMAAEAELVQVIGRNCLLFRRSEKKPTIELP